MILEQLYSGNIGPVHMRQYETEESKFYTEQVGKFEKRLVEKLDEHGQKLLRDLIEADNAANCTLAMGSFVHGFKLAVLIMAEALTTPESEMLHPEEYWRSMTRPYRPVVCADSDEG